jgi:hypothetical protein
MARVINLAILQTNISHNWNLHYVFMINDWSKILTSHIISIKYNINICHGRNIIIDVSKNHLWITSLDVKWIYFISSWDLCFCQVVTSFPSFFFGKWCPYMLIKVLLTYFFQPYLPHSFVLFTYMNMKRQIIM